MGILAVHITTVKIRAFHGNQAALGYLGHPGQIGGWWVPQNDVTMEAVRADDYFVFVTSRVYRGGGKITIGSKGLFCDLESTRRVCLCTLYPKPSPSKAISCVLSPKMNSPAHQTCDFIMSFGAENGNFWHISLLWHVAQIRGSMLKKIAQIRDTKSNQARYWSV